MANTYLTNFTYLFVPFTTEKLEDFPVFCRNILPENGWEPVEMNNRYLHRYVAEKISSHKNTAGSYFRLNPAFARKHHLYLGSTQYSTAPKRYRGTANDGFKFQIAGVELYTFDTAICILAFELRFPDSDPRKIASAQYNLRKISTEKIHAENDTASERFVDISERMLKDCARGLHLDFFFYATPENEKANFLTYIDVPKKDNYDEDLFYLKWCYSDTFEFSENCQDTDSINYIANPCTSWGFSVSAAVCLVHRSEQQKHFIETVFQKNFREQYLLTYILLLHQKYMMYLFLTKLSVGLEGNLGQLKKYKELLYHFETHYMFSYISEVPQYQRVYSKIRTVFSLDQLFSDVQEPLTQLTEMQEQKHESRTNTVLTTLSLLTVVSALTDATGITSGLNWWISNPTAQIIQYVVWGIVFFVAIGTFIRLFLLEKRRTVRYNKRRSKKSQTSRKGTTP